MGFSLWLADLVGGDSSDDIPFFDLVEDIAFMTDADGIGTEPFGSDPVGVASFGFLETPGNATDRIDNDGDGSTAPECMPIEGECNSPIVTEAFLVARILTMGLMITTTGSSTKTPPIFHSPVGRRRVQG